MFGLSFFYSTHKISCYLKQNLHSSKICCNFATYIHSFNYLYKYIDYEFKVMFTTYIVGFWHKCFCTRP